MPFRAASPSASSRCVSFSPPRGVRGRWHACGYGRRGSTLPLVLALLALLATVSTALVYTSRLEALAANNAGLAVKARAASIGGLPAGTADLPSQYGMPTNAAYAFSTEPTEPTWLAQTAARDLSACINLNEVAPYGAADAVALTPPAPAKSQKTPAAAATPAVPGQSARATAPATGKIPKTSVPTPTPAPASVTAPATIANGHAYTLPALVLERFLATHLAAANFSGAQAAPLAHAILAARDAMPEGRIGRMADLLDHVPGLTPKLYEQLSPFLSTSSSSLEFWRDPNGNGFVPVPINTASPEEILATLRTLYPGADLHLLRQFTANIVDRRGADRIPTVFDDEPGALPILGYKQTVVISEVVPDVATPSEMGDHGEYVEIYNPLSVAVDLTGWRVSWAGGGAPLDGSLAAGAYLIVTDDIKGDHDTNPLDHQYGIGSFYDVFHVLPTGANRIVEVLGMDIPDDSGVVMLYDPDNHLIDYLSYAGGIFNGLNRGFEKTSPFCRAGRSINAATPFSQTPYVPANEYEAYCWQQFLNGMDQPFACETDLLYVPTAYLLPGAMAPATQDNFPLLAVGQGLRPDLRLADAFTAGDIKPAFDAEGALVPCLVTEGSSSVPDLSSHNGSAIAPPGQASPRGQAAQPVRPAAGAKPDAPRTGSGKPSSKAASAAGPSRAVRLAAPRYSQGKINLNTARTDILAALPGLDNELAGLVSQAQAEARQNSVGAFASFAAFADRGVLWANRTAPQRLDILRALRPYVTLNSTSFVVVSKNCREPLGPDEKAAMRVTSLARVELGEGPRAHVVEWNFVKP